LVGKKGIRPVKTEWYGTGMVICLKQGASNLHKVQLMRLASLKSRMAYLPGAGIPRLCWKKAIKWM